LGGYVIGSVLGGARIRTVAARVGALVAALAILAIVLQATGFAAAPVLVR
jgi:hypothetical protein